MGRSRSWSWLVFLCGCGQSIQISADWGDAGPDGSAGQGGASGTGGSGGSSAGTAGSGGGNTGGSNAGSAGSAAASGSSAGTAGSGRGGSSGGSSDGGGSGGGMDGGSSDACVPTKGGAPVCQLAGTWFPSAACGAAACGNGVVDSCTNSCGEPVAEACDGSALGGLSCELLGYSGGTLRCLPQCQFDLTACTRCNRTDDIVRACMDAAVEAFIPSSLAIDATEQEIGVAWTSRDATGDLRLHFARFAPDLKLIAETGPFGPSCSGNIALAARPGGWSLAVAAGDKLQLLALDATGATTSDLPVGDLWPARTDLKLVLAHRDGSGPLLAWDDGSSGVSGEYGHHTVVKADGTLNGKPVGVDPTLALNAPTVGALAAIATPVGWLVASDHQSADGSNSRELEVVELSDEGIVIRDSPRSGVGTNYSMGQPRMAVDGTEFRISFVSDWATHFANMTYDGILKGPDAVRIGPGFVTPAPMVVIGDKTYIFPVDSVGSSEDLYVFGYDAQGNSLPWQRDLAHDGDAIQSIAAARRGPDAIVAWINGAPAFNPGSVAIGATVGNGPSTIGLARVTPPTP